MCKCGNQFRSNFFQFLCDKPNVLLTCISEISLTKRTIGTKAFQYAVSNVNTTIGFGLFRLERFIQSKFFNNPKEERLRELFRKIKKAKPVGGEFSALNPEQFGAKPTDFSDLLKLVKRYIAFTQFEKN